MSEQDPLSTYSLWAKQASILEEPNDYTTKPNGTNEKENMDERSRRNPGKEDSGYGVKPRQVVKQVPRRTRIVSSSDTDDAIMVRGHAFSLGRLGHANDASNMTGQGKESSRLSHEANTLSRSGRHAISMHGLAVLCFLLMGARNNHY